MKKLFFLLSILMFATWAVVFFVFHVKTMVHCLLAISVILYIQALITDPDAKLGSILKIK